MTMLPYLLTLSLIMAGPVLARTILIQVEDAADYDQDKHTLVTGGKTDNTQTFLIFLFPGVGKDCGQGGSCLDILQETVEETDFEADKEDHKLFTGGNS